MAITIDVGFKRAYSDTALAIIQQKTSLLMPAVSRANFDVSGEMFFIDRIGVVDLQELVAYNEATPLVDPEQTRRVGLPKPFHQAILLSPSAKKRLAAGNQEFVYLEDLTAAVGRHVDQVILDALYGTALTGKTGSGTQALPSGQKVAHGSAVLTLAKIATAQKILLSGNVNLDQERFLVIPAEGLEDLMNISAFTSFDYMNEKPISSGQVGQILGFKVIVSSKLDAVANRIDATTWRALMFTKDACVLGMPEEMVMEMSVRDDRSYADQFYVRVDCAAVRVFDEAVVEIAFI